jgi:hypothetical protein
LEKDDKPSMLRECAAEIMLIAEIKRVSIPIVETKSQVLSYAVAPISICPFSSNYQRPAVIEKK